jgi:hypothetical protein
MGLKEKENEMIIPFRQLKEKIKTEKGWWAYDNMSNIDNQDLSVIMLCILFHNKKISRERFVARMQQYFKTKDSYIMISRRLGTYKSELLNRWYSDISLTNVYVEEVFETCTCNDLTIEDYLKYLNIGFNRNRNFCIDFIAFSVFRKVIHHWDKNWAYDFLTSCGIKDLNLSYLSYEEADRNYDLSFGYCCEDCDGCLRQYKESRYDYLYKNDAEKELTEKFRDIFMNMKKHLKNPNEKLFTF